MTSITKELAPTLVSINATHAEDPFSGKWLVYLQPEETRTSDVNGHLSGATLRVYCWIILRPNPQAHRPTRGCYFDASYSARDNLAAVVDSVLFLDPDELRGLGLGSLMMNQIIEWVRQWPDARVKEIDIGINREVARRRERFYAKFGLVFAKDSSLEHSPRMLPVLVKELDTAFIPDSLVLHNIPGILLRLANQARDTQRTLATRESALEEAIKFRKQFFSRPLCMGLKYFFQINLPWLSILTVIGALGIFYWLSSSG